MKFGIALPPAQPMPGQPEWTHGDDPAPILAIARKADELGYAWLPCSDHVVVPGRAVPSMGTQWYEPATTLAFIAGITSRVRLLAHVVVLPYHSPFDVAKQYATLDRLSGGRVILGIGTGHLRGEFRALDAPFEERGAVTDERLRVIKALWSDAAASFAGSAYQFRDLHLAPRPVQQPHPPIWVGGNSRRAVRRAVELAQGWIPFEVTLEQVVAALDYARALPDYERRDAPLDVVAPAGPVEIASAPIAGARGRFTGHRDQVRDDVADYERGGVTGLTVGFRARTLAAYLEQMDRFASEIMPAFR